jgi:hypothetical protein
MQAWTKQIREDNTVKPSKQDAKNPINKLNKPDKTLTNPASTDQKSKLQQIKQKSFNR